MRCMVYEAYGVLLSEDDHALDVINKEEPALNAIVYEALKDLLNQQNLYSDHAIIQIMYLLQDYVHSCPL
jgi:hypothetical protein